MTHPTEPNNQGGELGPVPGQPSDQKPMWPPHQLPPQPPWNQLPPPGGDQKNNAGQGGSAKRPDVSAGTTLLVAVPWFFWSLVIVLWVASVFGRWNWIVVGLWVLSGAVTFFSPVEDLVARYLYRLRRPTLVEEQRLRPAWLQLLGRAGIQDSRFSLWIQESDDVNATPTPGHTVAVSRWALYTLPTSHLEAALAHELSHHLGGRAWLSLLNFWYSIPARCALVGVRALVRLMKKVPAVGCAVVGFLVLAYSGILLAVLTFGDGYVTALLFLTPFIAPPILAWLNRWQVKQADRRAAQMGYGTTLVQVLYGWQMQNQQMFGRDTSRRTQLMSSTPSLVERVQTLERATSTLPQDPY
ncbi:M48 family metalloprotease [Kribbella sp. CA-247076]|uniref:M48 family metalloprotease n=1 Tax=Kribbella sp. CA-247076 TaxID=3239941 RepID=UPI003D93CCD0